MPIQTTDQGELRVLGENAVMYLYSGDATAPGTSINHWRVQFSPVGPGTTLFLSSQIVEGGPRIYSDNIALCRLLQAEIIRAGQPYKDATIPVATAQFSRDALLPWRVSERVVAHDHSIELAWYDFFPAFAGHTSPDPKSAETYGHYAVYFPAARAQMAFNGVVAPGAPRQSDRDGRHNTTALVAMAESWQRYP